MPIAERIRTKLTEGLSPVRLEVEDQSHRHVGHAGHDGRGESHFAVTVVSEAFAGMPRVDRQRLVYRLLAEEMAERIHALAIAARTPEEAGL
jgi:BolA protein